MQLTYVVNMECSVLLHANTVVAKNVRMSVSMHVRHGTCEASDLMKAVLMMMAWNLLMKMMAL